MRIARVYLLAVLSPFFLAHCGWCQQPQKIDRLDRMRAHMMLYRAYLDVKKNYYDPVYHGVDLDASYRELDARIDSAPVSDSLFIIATFLGRLNDSHTYFLPPPRVRRWAPGFAMEMVGEKCFVIRIRPGSDANGKLQVGDQVLAIGGSAANRANLARARYFASALWDLPDQTLLVKRPNGTIASETIHPMVRYGKANLNFSGSGSDMWDLIRENEDIERVNRGRTFEVGDTLIWKMPSFFVSPEGIDLMFAKARKHKVLILDLRGNSGGSMEALDEMIGNIFDHEIIAGTEVSRKGAKADAIKPVAKPFRGDLIVLIDSESKSAAEVFARVVQLEHRGKVIGDRSAGAAMEARRFDEWIGVGDKVFYSFSISSAGLVMSDGRSIENAGVIPDESVLPTADDLAGNKDPALSRAAEIAETRLDPADAGKLFPLEWTPF